MEISFENFIKFKIVVGTIISVKNNIKARKPSYILKINFGEKIGIKKTSAQITNYDFDVLLDRQIVAVTNFPSKNVAGVESEVLILGALTDMGVKLLKIDEKIQNGTMIG